MKNGTKSANAIPAAFWVSEDVLVEVPDPLK